MAPKDTELYDLLGVQPEATDIEYVPVEIQAKSAYRSRVYQLFTDNVG